MKVYTKTGDDGTTGLIGGTRVKKYHIRLESYGTVDELNSWIGLLRSQPIAQQHIDFLIEIQNKLFVIGASLATDTSATNIREQIPCTKEDISVLEKEMDRLDGTLPPMQFFVLPGGSNSISYCHLARTVCRRAERNAIKLSEECDVDKNVIKYLNRLSDYLFVLSRSLSHDENIEEVPWMLKK